MCSLHLLQVQCGEHFVERSIEDKIDQFYAWVEKHPGKRGQVCCCAAAGLSTQWGTALLSPCWASQVILAFFEKRKTQRWSLIGGKQEERLYWEQW